MQFTIPSSVVPTRQDAWVRPTLSNWQAGSAKPANFDARALFPAASFDAPSPEPVDVPPVAMPGELREQAILDVLRRICMSETFRNAPRMQKFLTYVVEETLEGRSKYLKSFTIGMEVFGRTATADASQDGVVRTAAHRLRSALRDYYTSPRSTHDPVVIHLRKGSYVPEFLVRDEVEPGCDPDLATKAASPRLSKEWRRMIFLGLAFVAALSIVFVAFASIGAVTALPDGGGQIALVVAEPIQYNGPSAQVRSFHQRLISDLAAGGQVKVVDGAGPAGLATIVEQQLATMSEADEVFLLSSDVSLAPDQNNVVWSLTDLRTGIVERSGRTGHLASDMDALVRIMVTALVGAGSAPAFVAVTGPAQTARTECRHGTGCL